MHTAIIQIRGNLENDKLSEVFKILKDYKLIKNREGYDFYSKNINKARKDSAKISKMFNVPFNQSTKYKGMINGKHAYNFFFSIKIP